MYNKLKDEWDTMNGTYMGKNFSGIGDIFNILEIPKEDVRTVFDLICTIDRHRAETIAAKKQAEQPPNKAAK